MKGATMISISQQRFRVSRRARAAGTFMIFAGVLGIAVAIGLSVWAVHDLSNSKAFPAGSVAIVNKIDIVAVAGVTPALISLLVIAAGVHLRTKSFDLLIDRLGEDIDLDAHGRPEEKQGGA
jgi:hypothetical protein